MRGGPFLRSGVFPVVRPHLGNTVYLDYAGISAGRGTSVVALDGGRSSWNSIEQRQEGLRASLEVRSTDSAQAATEWVVKSDVSLPLHADQSLCRVLFAVPLISPPRPRISSPRSDTKCRWAVGRRWGCQKPKGGVTPLMASRPSP